MTIFTFGAAMPSYASIQHLFDLGSLTLTGETPTQATFEDQNGYSIILMGSQLTYDAGAVTGGTVTSMKFLDDQGQELLTATSGNYSAKTITAEFVGNDNLWQFLTLIAAGNDTYHGNDNGTVMSLGEDHGNDKYFSGDGGSYVGGSEGNDSMKGGEDWNNLSYSETYWRQDARWGIVLNAAKGIVIDSWHDKDTFSGFEEYQGSIFNDRMTGSKRDESLMGLKGNDTIDGGKGWDDIRYQEDHQYDGNAGIRANLAKGFVIDGFGDRDKVSNIEGVIGTSQDDSFVGSGVDNKFRGLDGVDSFNGGKGMDDVEFQYWRDEGQTGVVVDLSLTTGQIVNDGYGNTETTKSIEAVSGSQFDDHIKLGKGGGWVWGNDGDDVLEGGEETGDNWQWFGGGAGQDTFVFASLDALGNGKSSRDQIDDFSQQDGDLIDLSAITGLVFGGEGALTGVEGEIRYTIANGKTIISADTDGNGKPDFQLQLNVEVDLVAGDFLLPV